MIKPTQVSFFAFLFILVSGTIAKAQTFAPQGSYWHYCNMGLGSFSYYDSISYRGDSSIAGKNFKIIGSNLFHVNGDTTFIYNGGELIPLYNFSLEMGDTMRFINGKNADFWVLGSSQGYVTCEVVERGKLLLGNDSVRYYKLSGINSSFSNDSNFFDYSYVNMTIVEKVGLFDHSPGKIIPRFNCGVCDYHMPFLTRYDIPFNQVIYQHAWFTGCGYLSNELNEFWQGKIYPNPTTGEVNISSPYSENVVAYLSDIYGRKVKDKILIYGNSTGLFSIEDLSAGVYILHIPLKNGNVVTQKIVKN